MAIKIPVVNRVPTYPGRVTLTPVTGQPNTYDMERADEPLVIGTPQDAALFDNKAYTMTESATVYVKGSIGNDDTGDGSEGNPFATIQRAINEIPKCLGGFHVTVDIEEGTYPERVMIDGFYGGRLSLGIADRPVTINGLSVLSSSVIRVNISNIVATVRDTMFYIGAGSNVLILSPMTLDGASVATNGISIEQNSTLTAISAAVTVDNCLTNAVLALTGGKATFGSIEGTNAAGTAIRADAGSTISYVTRSITAPTAQLTVGGGRIYSGAQSNVPTY